MTSVKKLCICAVCTALCYVLPILFHILSLGSALSPMHIPVLLCGLICGWPYGAVCGLAGPALSCLLSGMPPAAVLVYMAPELCAYGLFTGLLFRLIRTGHTAADLYLALIPAMVLGRVVGGVVQAVFYLATARTYSIALWASAYVVEALPAIILHLIALPLLVLTLMKARLIPARYSKTAA